jgi:hypothetical protein
MALVANDPGCVKTHTSAKCRKDNSPTRGRTPRVQYDLTLRYGITPRCFYVRGAYRSFHTTKTQSGHWPDRNPAAQHTLADLLWREEVVQTLQLRDNKWRQVKMDISRQGSVRSFFRACPSGRQPLRVLAPYPSRFRCRANRNTQLSDQKCRWGRLGPIIEASRRRARCRGHRQPIPSSEPRLALNSWLRCSRRS